MSMGSPFPVQGQFACSVCGTLLGFYVNECPQCRQNELLEEANRIKREELRYQQTQQYTSYQQPTTQYTQPMSDYERDIFIAISKLDREDKEVSSRNIFMMVICLLIAIVAAFTLYQTPFTLFSLNYVTALGLSLSGALYFSE